MKNYTKILIAEHDSHDLEMLHHELTEGGIKYTAKVVQNEQEYINALITFMPDIILADYSFPTFDGPAAFDIREKMTPETPFIIVSGTIGEEKFIELIKRGVTDYVLKDKLFTLITKMKRALKDAKDRQQRNTTNLELTNSEKRYRQIVETAQEGIWLIDENNYTTLVNQKMADILGYTIEEMIGKENYFFMDEEWKKKAIGHIVNRKLGQNETHEFKYITKSGKEVYTSLTTNPVFDDSGNYAGALAMITDITERKVREQEMAWLINNTEESFILLNRELEIVSFNRQFKDLYFRYLGIAIVKGRSILDYAQAGRHDKVKQIYERVIGGAEEYSELTIPLDDGTEKKFAIKYKPAENEEGKIIGAFVSAIDITEKRKSEQQLIVNEKRYRALIENGADGVAIISAEGKLLYVSPTVKSILGYSEEEIMKLDIFSLAHPDDAADISTVWEQMMSTPGVAVHGQASRMLHKDGSWRWLEATVTNMLHDPVLNGIVDNFRDVTDKIEAEKLREFERRDKEALINTTTDLIWSVSSDFNLIAANVAFIESVKSFSGIYINPGERLLMEEKFPAAYLSLWEQLYSRAMSGESFVNEIHTPGSGNYPERWSETVFNPIYDGDIVTGIACYSRDITKQKDAAAQLYLFESIVSSSDDAIISQNPEGVIKSWNPGAERMFGFTEKEAVGKDITIIIPKGLINDERAIVAGMKETRHVNRFETERSRKDGSCISVSVTISPLLDSDGNIAGASNIARDITERKKAEADLIKRDSQLILATDMAKLGYWEYDVVNDVFTFNDQFYAIFKTSAEQVGGYTMSSARYTGLFVHPDDKDIVASSVAEAAGSMDSSFSYKTEHRIKYANGETGYISVHFYIIKDSKGQTIKNFGVNQDITERKLSEIRLNDLNENLQKHLKELAISNAELEQFAYVASHDLQEPLRMITSFLVQLEKKYGNIIDDKGKKYIGFAVDGSRRMRQIILDLLEFSRVGRSEDNREKIDLNELVNEVKIVFRKKIEEKSATIIVNNLPHVYNYRSPLHQVFQNLVGNALTYAMENIPAKIQITCEEFDSHWQFSVIDNGIGIAKEYFNKIFIIFQRLHNKDEYSGTGMGLAITKKIVEGLGGRIWVESEEGRGSTFHFTLLKATVS